MPIDSRIKAQAQEWLATSLLVFALGGGWYMVDVEAVPGELRFLEVGWWNIRDLGPSRDATEIAQIAEVIQDLEVVAVGEVNKTNALARMAEELGPEWEYDATPSKVGHTSGTSEYYGFLWDSDVVEMVGLVHVDQDPEDLIDREPAWATFRTVDGRLDFTVIAVHVTWGSRVGPRKAEVKLMKDVWQRTQAATPGDDDLVLVGDFNRNVNCASFDSLLSIPGVIRANQDTGPAKIKSSSTYDQIFIDTSHTTEWTGEWQTIAFDELYFGNDDPAASLAASDHRPVWVRLVVTGVNDD